MKINFKNLSLLAAAVIVSFSMTACGSSDEEETTEGEPAVEETVETTDQVIEEPAVEETEEATDETTDETSTEEGSTEVKEVTE